MTEAETPPDPKPGPLGRVLRAAPISAMAAACAMILLAALLVATGAIAEPASSESGQSVSGQSVSGSVAGAALLRGARAEMRARVDLNDAEAREDAALAAAIAASRQGGGYASGADLNIVVEGDVAEPTGSGARADAAGDAPEHDTGHGG